MPSIVKNSDAEACLRLVLKSQGFELSKQRGYGETGVDIVATRGEEKYHIEVIGHKKSPPARSRDFYESFFRAISRLKNGAKCCVIALPIQSKKGLPARANQYGEAWKRIGDSFPELEIWLIDVEQLKYERSSWNHWLDTDC